MDNWIYFLVAFGGAIGGLLFNIKERKFELPYVIRSTEAHESKNSYIYLGFISDLIFGIAGGFVIFIILPSIPSTEDEWGIIKIISLSILGGYSGRAIVQKTSEEQVKKTQEQVNRIQGQGERTEQKLNKLKEQVKMTEENSATALKVLYQILNNKRVFNQREVEEVFVNAPNSIVIHAFGMIEETREHIVYKLLNYEDTFPEEIPRIRKRFDNLISSIIALINIEESNPKLGRDYRHIHYASLGYLYKDKSIPQWDKSLKFIDKAISEHMANYKDEKVRPVYLFNKFICYINLHEDNKAAELFDHFWNEEGQFCEMLANSREVIAPRIHKWVIENRKEQINRYLETHKKHLGDRVMNIWVDYLNHI